MTQQRKYNLWGLLLLSAIAIAVILRIINLGSRELWYDEVLSLLLVTGQKTFYQTPQDLPVVLANYHKLLFLPVENSIGDIFDTGEKLLKGLVAEPHPPLFFLGQHLWLRLFGTSEVAMRSLVASYSIGAMICAYGLGRCLLGHRGGLLWAALLGLNPYFLFHSLNVRMYCSLVFWTLLSGWATLELIGVRQTHRKLSFVSFGYRNKLLRQVSIFRQSNAKPSWIWNVVQIGAVTAGLMTFYYFLFWVATLAVLVLLLDKKRWWQHGLRLSIGIFITTPWLLWGTRQQLNNADLGRFSASSNLLETAWRHLEGVLNTLGTHLVVGDWASVLPPVASTLAGIGAIALLVSCSMSLWHNHQQQIFLVAFVLGILPLLLMLAVDVVGSKFTVGFGWGRSLIFILPGCLLFVAAWIEKAAGRWQIIAATTLLIFYLSVSVADFSVRSRWMFHQIADTIEQESAKPTLIVMNSNAWGHVLRLAYYLPKDSSVMLLAQNSARLAPALEKTLAAPPESYQRILWLESDRPVWGSPATDADRKQIRQILEKQFQSVKTERLLGTWELDHFIANLYQRRLPPS